MQHEEQGKDLNMVNPATLKALAEGDLENALIAATPGGIEAQEAQGQRDLVSNFNRLPKEYEMREEFPRQLLERLGFKIGSEVDEIFMEVTPPAGWTMQPTEHSMWSHLCDAQGRQRGSVFYKAAFYDRRAHFSLDTRYFVDSERKGETYETQELRGVAKDRATGEVFNDEPWLKRRERDDERKQRTRSEAVLDARFPDWRSVEAYW